MINTSQDFESALNYVSADIDYTSAKISGDMNSAAFNRVFLDIEEKINILYEKIRLLEDIRDYTKLFVVRAIQERRTKIMENLRVIETLTDETKNKGSITYVIVPNEGETVYDRDGTVISQFESTDGTLVFPGQSLVFEYASSVINKGTVADNEVQKQDPVQGDYTAVEPVPFNSAEPFASADLLIKDGASHFDIYCSDEPCRDKFQVQFDITFSGKIKSNYINFNPVNCKVVSVKLYDTDNIMTELLPEQRYFSLMRLAKAVIIVECSNYERYVLAVPSRGKDDAFDKAITGGEIYE